MTRKSLLSWIFHDRRQIMLTMVLGASLAGCTITPTPPPVVRGTLPTFNPSYSYMTVTQIADSSSTANTTFYAESTGNWVSGGRSPYILPLVNTASPTSDPDPVIYQHTFTTPKAADGSTSSTTAVAGAYTITDTATSAYNMYIGLAPGSGVNRTDSTNNKDCFNGSVSETDIGIHAEWTLGSNPLPPSGASFCGVKYQFPLTVFVPSGGFERVVINLNYYDTPSGGTKMLLCNLPINIKYTTAGVFNHTISGSVLFLDANGHPYTLPASSKLIIDGDIIYKVGIGTP